jgi:hypothetical protein
VEFWGTITVVLFAGAAGLLLLIHPDSSKGTRKNISSKGFMLDTSLTRQDPSQGIQHSMDRRRLGATARITGAPFQAASPRVNAQLSSNYAVTGLYILRQRCANDCAYSVMVWRIPTTNQQPQGNRP